jgi:PAS domain S-box-containing protein
MLSKEGAVEWFEGDLYHQLLETAPDAIIVVGEDARIELVNRQTENLFGYDRAELLGRPLEILIPRRFHATHVEHIRRFFSAPTTRQMGSGLQLFGCRKNGAELPIEVSLSPLQTKTRVLVSAAIRDVTDRKRMENLAEAGSAAKSDFLASMSHELRTPLNAVLGFAQLLHRDKKEPLSARHRERVDHILKGGEHLLRLIDDILDLSGIESGNVAISPEPLSASTVLLEVMATLETSAARAGISLELAPLPLDVPMIAADRTRFAQILMNFGSNAIKYNRVGGRATFILSMPNHNCVRVTVKDTGMGIAEDQQDKLFQPFQRAGQETGSIEGTGIGLTISKRLAGLMRGSIGFRSVTMIGSEFWIDMPVHDSRTVSVPPAQDEESFNLSVSTQGLVLYVEDNPANVIFMRDVLSNFPGVQLITAPTAEIGIDLARVRQPKIIIMDINFPGMNGLEALRVLRETRETRHIPIVALTAAASPHDKQRGERAGFYRYLTKPVKVDELENVFHAILTLPKY